MIISERGNSPHWLAVVCPTWESGFNLHVQALGLGSGTEGRYSPTPHRLSRPTPKPFSSLGPQMCIHQKGFPAYPRSPHFPEEKTIPATHLF